MGFYVMLMGIHGILCDVNGIWWVRVYCISIICIWFHQAWLGNPRTSHARWVGVCLWENHRTKCRRTTGIDVYWLREAFSCVPINFGWKVPLGLFFSRDHVVVWWNHVVPPCGEPNWRVDKWCHQLRRHRSPWAKQLKGLGKSPVTRCFHPSVAADR